MRLLRYVGSEFRYIYGNWQRAIPVFAILLIPILYAGMFLWAFWNPYGHLDKLPVAVVNQDHGAVMHGIQVDAGAKLVNQLKSNHDMDWQFVSRAQAEQGLHTNQYYMMLEIPPQFSAEAVNAVEHVGQPVPKLIGITNDRANFIAGKLASDALNTVRTQMANALTEQDTKVLLQQMSLLSGGYQSAASGASQVADGAHTLQAQSGQLVRASEQVSAGAKQIDTSAVQAASAAQTLARGDASLLSGTEQLRAGLDSLATGSQSAASGAQSVLNGAKQVQQGLQSTVNGTQNVANGSGQLALGMQKLASANPTLATDPEFKQLLSLSQQVHTGAQKVAAASQSLVSGANDVVQGQSNVVQGLNHLSSGMQQSNQGAKQLELHQETLVLGQRQLAAGLQSLATGAGKEANGSAALQTGTAQFAQGVAKVATGSLQLSSNLQSAAKKASATPHDRNQLASVIAHPVNLQTAKLGNIQNYGTGFTPYFLSLGLYVGVLMMSIVIEFRKPIGHPDSPVVWFFGKFILLATVGMVQAVIADLILLYGLGVHVQHVGQFFGFSILLSLTYVAILQFLVTAFENPGRFVGVMILILQLTSSSGSYPVVLSSRFFQVIANGFPMTYAIEAFRYLIGGGDVTMYIEDILWLVICLLVFMIFSIFYFIFLSHRDPNEMTLEGVQA